jgi:predicted TIM-barrel fold metal-dependent hydrolase
VSVPVWQQLGLPGLADVHVHIMPPSVERKVWGFFEHAQEHYGQAWPIAYAWPLEQRRKELQTLGVRAYPGLVYPHKAGMATWLNEWALEYADATPEVVASATFYPDPDAVAYVRDAMDRGARLFKAHLQVGGYDPRDPLLDGVWGLLAEAGIPVVTHCGDGPIPGPHTGVGPIGDVIARHPTLRLVIAHAGMPRYADFLGLAERYESVLLDTTMAFTDFVEASAPFPRELLPALRDLGLAGRVLLGSDFPSIPYRYEDQLEALVRLELGDDWLRQVLWTAPAALLGVGE